MTLRELDVAPAPDAPEHAGDSTAAPHSTSAGDATMRTCAAANAWPLVSVVIPCFNHGHFLGEAIESVRGQTHGRVETIVVDDGSTDETAAVAARYPDVRYVRQENQGLAAARNTGLRHAGGEYLVFLDADDRLLPDALAAGLACLDAHPSAAFTWGHFRYVHGDGSPSNEKPPARVADADAYCALLRKNHIAMHATVMYRRAPLEGVGGFDPRLRACEDYDVYLRIASDALICGHDRVVAEYRKHDVNMSHDTDLMLDTVLAVLAKQAEHASASRARRRAHRAGIRFYRDFYAEQFVGQLRRDPRRLLNGRAALRGTMLMLRYGPKWMGRRLLAGLRWLAPRMQRRLTAPRVGHVDFGDLRRTVPISDVFGYDRGRPVDRYYIERFLGEHAADIHGRVLEIGDNAYTRRFGGDRVVTSDVLHVDPQSPHATFVGDLTTADHVPSDAFDCVVLTQTLHLIYDVRAALATLHRILKPGGVLLATFPGISHIDTGKWAGTWCWSFTLHSATRLFGEVFPPYATTLQTHGNVLAATAFLQGLAVEDLRAPELDRHDPHYQVIITARAVKPSITAADAQQ